MKGSEFRAIRRFNKITMMDIAVKLDYKSNGAIKEIEEYDAVPILFVKKLSELVEIDLSNENNLEKALNGIPEKFYKKRYLRPTFFKRPKGNQTIYSI